MPSGFEKPLLISNHERIANILKIIERVAPYKTTCLILGESGTGKELVARLIHDQSPRRNNRFIAINCGAIPENLLESELFGYEKGAFTGATKSKKGLFEEANGGTLFLDEIGEMPLLLQAKLLRVLQEEEIRRVGDVNPIKTDVRIIAATLKDLSIAVKQGTFRDDLFYRLNVLPIRIPPLRHRIEDIPTLANHFIQSLNQKLKTNITGIDSEVLERWKGYDWPGNVRELENTIERSMVMVRQGTIGLKDLQHDFIPKLRDSTLKSYRVEEPQEDLSIKKRTREIEEELILKALERTHGNRTHAAKLLEISHRALLYKLKEYNLLDKIKK
ncbi:MAG: sigma 54-interacting transcriptional regulator [Bdellovibrionota bacterium]